MKRVSEIKRKRKEEHISVREAPTDTLERSYCSARNLLGRRPVDLRRLLLKRNGLVWK